MSKDKTTTQASRRGFVKGAMGVVVAVPLAAVLRGQDALADHHEMPKLTEDDPQAAALGYKHNAADAANAGEGQDCGNCQLYTGTNGEWGPCAIFPGKAVNTNGWCVTWAKKVG